MFFMMLVLAVAIINGATPLDIKVGSLTRHLEYVAPSGLNHPPLVIWMHGMGGNGNGAAEGTRWDSIAMREKIVVATPSGEGGQWDLGGTKDIDFIMAIIDTMARRYNIDRNRVYASGWSMGGMMSYYLACKVPDKIAAIGPSSGYPMGGESGCNTKRFVPVYHNHGIYDDFVKYSNLHGYLNSKINAYSCPTKADSSTAMKHLMEYWGPCQKDGKTSEIYLESDIKPHYYGWTESYKMWNFFKNHDLTDTVIPGVVTYQKGNFRGRVTRLVKGNYTDTLLKYAGNPDSAIGSIKVDSGLTVEIFAKDNFQEPLATFTKDVADFSSYKNEVRSLRITATTTSVHTRVISHQVLRMHWSEGTLVYTGIKSGRVQIVDTQGKSRILELSRGKAVTGHLPTGIYYARLFDGKHNEVQSFMVQAH
jgi:predicted esterase